ncbi:hypothetical protein L1887_39240 [Cichorium endivia]|nr:hypothetical protein L1887_39240 [Cichorium endivia]
MSLGQPVNLDSSDISQQTDCKTKIFFAYDVGINNQSYYFIYILSQADNSNLIIEKNTHTTIKIHPHNRRGFRHSSNTYTHSIFLQSRSSISPIFHRIQTPTFYSSSLDSGD